MENIRLVEEADTQV